MQSGDRIGRYELIKEIGRGGMGSVWSAELCGPRGFRRQVALKVQHSPNRGKLEELMREARLGGLVAHPNVVPTLELGVDGEVWFISMGMVNGPTLAQLLKRGVLPPAAVLDVAIQVSGGLAHLHELEVDGRPQPLIHRDIKPTNIMVDDAGLVKLVDLGIAGWASVSKSRAGTPGFMPPEQYDGEEGPPADLFALGITLYLLATRKKLLQGGRLGLPSTMKIEDRIHGGPFEVSLRHIPGLAEILRRCLRFDPSHRIQSARELQQLCLALRAQHGGPGIFALIAPSARRVVPREPTLPALGPLFGRDRELKRLAETLRHGSPVCVVGPPGVGKTRLVRAALEGFQKPVFWVRGGGAESGRALADRIVVALGLVQPERWSSLWLVEALQAREALCLVLDGTDDVADMDGLATILSGVQKLSLVITSRRKLSVDGLKQLQLGPLDEESALSCYRYLLGRPIDRRAGLNIVRQLDGIPLALELSAAQEQPAQRPTRTHSVGLLEEVLTESWARLSTQAQGVLAELWVFEHDIRLRAVRAIVQRPWVFDGLQELVSASLLTVEGRGFRMLRSVREFARSRCENPQRTQARHAAWFANFGSVEALAALERSRGAERFSVLLSVQPDLSRAFRWSQRYGTAGVSHLALALLTIIRRVGPYDHAPALVRAALSCQNPPQLEAEIRSLGAYFAESVPGLGDVETLIDEGLRGLPLRWSGQLLRQKSAQHRGVEGLALLDRAEEAARLSGDMVLLGLIENNRMLRGDSDTHYLCGLEFSRSAGSRRVQGVLDANYANLVKGRGELAEAAEKYRRAIEAFTEVGDHINRVITIANLALMLTDLGYLDEASALLVEGEHTGRQLGFPVVLANNLLNQGSIALQRHEPLRAGQLFAEARSLCARFDHMRHLIDLNEVELAIYRQQWDWAWEMIQPRLGEGSLRRKVQTEIVAVKVLVGRNDLRRAVQLSARCLNRASQLGRPLEIALSHCARASVAKAMGKSPQKWIQKARNIADELGFHADSELRQALLSLDAASVGR